MAAGQNKLEEQFEELSNSAAVALTAGRFVEAEELLRHLIQLQQRALGPEHDQTLVSRFQHATALGKLRRFTEEDAMLREVLQVQQQDPRFGMEHEATLQTVTQLGYCLINQRRFREAEPMLRNVHALDVRVLGPHHVETLRIQMALGNCLYELSQLPEAERLLRDALEGFKAMVETNSPHVPPWVVASMIGAGMRDLACCWSKAGMQDEAEALLRAAVKHTRHRLGEENRITIDCMKWHATVLSAMGKHAAAEVMFRLAVQGSRVAYGWENSVTTEWTCKYVECLMNQQKWEAAEALIRDTLSHVQQALEEDHPTVLEWMRLLASSLLANGQGSKRSEARALLQRARDLARNRQG